MATGRYVFPIKAKQKKPPLLKDPLTLASDDPQQIEAWSKQHPGCNWGLSCGKSGLTVVDIDPKNGGNETYDRLQKNFDTYFPPTREVATPSGGRHLYYSNATPKSSSGKLGPGIDTRSTGGYVLLPGSAIEAGEYKWSNDLPLAPTPEWIFDALGAAMTKDPERNTPQCDLDDSVNILRATTFLLKEASVDHTGYEVACQVRDLGISEDLCFDLMWEYYADRCVDPWEPEILRQKVENAYRYAQNQAGVLAPSSVIEMFPDIAPAETSRSCIPKKRLSDTRIEDIPARQWVLGRRYLRPYITITAAPGGVGKSTLTMLEAVAIATGRPLTGETVYRQGKVWIYNTEDPQDELDRRLLAISEQYGLTDSDRANIYSTSGWDKPLILVNDSPAGPVTNKAAIHAMIQTIREENIVHICVDPLVRCHTLSENDNVGMDKVILAFAQICVATGCSASVVHHTKKGKSDPGDLDSMRGASSIGAAVRIAHTLKTMTAVEACSLKIPEHKARWFVRLDDAKANLSPPGEGARWFERISVELANGDCVGAMKPAAFTADDLLSEEDRTIVDAVFKHWCEPVTCHRMAQELKKQSAEEFGRSLDSLKKQIIRLFFSVEREHRGRILTARLEEGPKSRAYFLMCLKDRKEEEEDF